MKKVVLILSAAVFTTAFIACKNEKTPNSVPTTSEMEISTESSSEDLALANISEAASEVNYRYVTAYSGLSLREYNNLQSERLARMPYGTKVKIVKTEGKATMNVAGIKGAMDEVEFNHKKGFAFNGYLSKYFPPERDISAKGYVDELQQLFPKVTYVETKGGTASSPINTEAITLPEAQWHEAFITAQRLFDFPKEFRFPNPKGKKTEVLFDGKPKKGVWTSQLEVTRNDDGLEKIEYVYGSDRYNTTVTVVKEGDAMKISRTEQLK